MSIHIYAYLFDFNGLDELRKTITLKKEIKQLEDRKSNLLNGQTLIDYKERLVGLDLEIADLNKMGEEYDIAFFQDKSLEELRRSRVETAELSTNISSLETQLHFNKKTVAMYESNIKEIDIPAIKHIYDEVKSIIPDLSKELSDVVSFHNSIFAKKAQYVKGQIASIKHSLESKKKLLDEHLKKEKELFSLISKDGHLSGFLIIEKEIQEKREQRGKLSYLVDEVTSVNSELSKKERELVETQEIIENEVDTLNENLKLFNQSYETITNRIFKRRKNSLIQTINDKGQLQFSIVNDHQNTGDGVPRVAAMAFDIAMIEYVKAKNMKLFHFTLQDYLESIDEESMKSLLKYTEQQGTQVVISILSDKLNILSKREVDSFTVLKLSKSDKFFGI